VVAAAAVTYFTVAVRFPVLRDHAPLNIALALIGVGMAMRGILLRRSWHSIVGYGFALALCGLFFYHLFVYSAQLPSADTAPRVGQQAPPLMLVDHTGTSISLEALRPRRVLVVFYRGFW